MTELVEMTANTSAKYISEEALVQDFLAGLSSPSSPWTDLKTTTEFYYVTGRADVVALAPDNMLIAFEAKLTRWRIALHQAFRNTFFAKQSFVVLPEKSANQAIKYAAEFERRNVGLCSVKDGQVSVLLGAVNVEPISPWLAARAADVIRSGDGQVLH